VARNDRRREKNRRQAEKQQEQLGNGQPGTPAPGDEDAPKQQAPHHDLMPDAEGAPDPIAHATPDAELAAAQMALGRPEYAEVPDPDELQAFEEEQHDDDLDEAAPAAGALSTTGGGGGGRGRRREVAVGGSGNESHPDHRPSQIGRLTGFIRGCWTELQRVQWPDRRQVAQATGVVLGFVIVAGAFLGVADLVASKLVNLIIK
jgi:preprotein translocase subunit SecE